MNVQDNSAAKIPWMKIGLIVGVIVLVGVFSGRAGIEKMLGLDPGTLGGTAVAEKDQDDQPKFDLDSDWKKDNSNSGNSSSNSNAQSNSDFALKRDGFVMKSPEGLTYYVGDRGENRVDHVMRHAKDSPSRPSHGVFNGSKNDILQTIDEAYALIKSNSRQVVKTTKDREIKTRVAYEVDMKRKIGYKGGKSGQRDGHPDLSTVKLILDKGNRVITAYPYR
jgi:hypothetical protein